MKIAMLFTQLEVGGAQTRTFQTASELRRRGHQVDVYSIYQARPCFENEEKTILAANKKPTNVLLAIFRLWGGLRRGKYDAFISNTAPANIIGTAVAASVGIKRRYAWQTQPPQKLSLTIQVLDHLWGRLGVYTRSVANSAWTRSCFTDRSTAYLRRMTTIPNGIIPRTDDRDKDLVRAEIGMPHDRRVLLTVGRLSRQKGRETAIASMALIPNALLYIVGDGENRAQLVEQAQQLAVSDRVFFVGEIAGESLARYFRAADIFVFPSRWETFGLAAVEAAASGLPLIHSDIEVLREVTTLPDGSAAGISVPTDDASALAIAVRRVLDDETMLHRLREQSLAIGRAHSLETHTSRILSLIMEGNVRAAETLPLSDAVLQYCNEVNPIAYRFWTTGEGDVQRIGWQDHADIIYTFRLLNRMGALSPLAAQGYLDQIATAPLYGRPRDASPAPNAHLTAYILGSAWLIEQFSEARLPDAAFEGWNADTIIDPMTHTPRFPKVWAHHIWRVSHWIGGGPSILLNLARWERVRGVDMALVHRVLDATEQRLMDPATDLLRPYRSQLLQWVFRQLYRMRHDPDVADIGGVAHVLWVNYALGRPYRNATQLLEKANRHMIENTPFIEDTPYCLDFDVVQLVRTAQPTKEIHCVTQQRAEALAADIARYLALIPDKGFSLHKVPGALAALHEASCLAGRTCAGGLDIPTIDIIKEAGWL